MNAIDLSAYTHFTVIPGAWAQLWTSEACEECGRACVGPNPLKVQLSGSWTSRLLTRKFGLQEAQRMPEELGACDALGGIAVCDSCWIED